MVGIIPSPLQDQLEMGQFLNQQYPGWCTILLKWYMLPLLMRSHISSLHKLPLKMIQNQRSKSRLELHTFFILLCFHKALCVVEEEVIIQASLLTLIPLDLTPWM
jgi:hypothetical protein